MKRSFPITTWLFCMLVLAITPTTSVMGAVELLGGMLRFGGSPRLVNHSWAYLNYNIRNPDPVEVEVTLSLRPELDTEVVYEKLIRLGPNAALNGRELVTVTPAETFVLSLIQNDQTVQKTTIFAASSGIINRNRLFLINDDADFGGMSALSKSNLLVKRVQVTSVAAQNAPHDLVGYGDSSILVLGYPRYDQMTAQQFEAVRNFVSRGGVLLFTSPEGTLKAAQTPLAPLLAADPVRVRRVESLPPLDKWGEYFYHKKIKSQAENSLPRKALEHEEGIQFVELLPRENAITTLDYRELPIVVWRRFGLGKVGMLAVEPNSQLMKESACFDALWDHCLSWSRRPFLFSYSEAGTSVRRILNLLTGFRIPDASVIRWILLGYLLLLLLILGAGYTFRRQSESWLAAAITGILLTAGLFAAAFQRNVSRPEQSATIADFRFPAAGSESSHAAVSLLSKHDMRPTLIGTSRTYIRHLAPPNYRAFGQKQLLSAPLRVSRVDDVPALPNLNLQTLRPRTVATVKTSETENLFNAPVLLLNENGFAMTPWQLPGAIPVDKADCYFIFSYGVRRGVLRGRNLHLAESQSMLRLNTLAQEYENFFNADFFPAPCLAIVSPREQTQGALALPEFEQRGYTTVFLPLHVNMQGPKVTIPSSLIGVDLQDTRVRLYHQNGRWQESLLRQNEQIIPFTAMTSPLVRSLDVEHVSVELDVQNSGENVHWDVGLLPAQMLSARDASEQWDDALKVAQRNGSSFEFEVNDGINEFFDPITGRFCILLRVYQEKVMTESIESERANAWRISKFNISLKGSLSEKSAAMRF